MSHLGDRIQDLRKQHNLSQQDLADKTKISKSQINRYENRGVQPPADVLNKLASVLDTSIDFLINGDKTQKAKKAIADNDLLKYFQEVSNMPEEDKKTATKVLKALVWEYKTRVGYVA